MTKVSDYIFDYLQSKGIDTIFSVSGGMSAHLLNSVRSKKFTFICNYNEQACAMSAEGYARISNKPACVLVTNGPGSSNTLTGVLGAYQDSVPMIIISGQVPANQSLGSLKNINLRQFGVQECDIISIVKPITKYAVQVSNPNEVPYILDRAYFESVTGRKGPVWIDVPLDIQNDSIKFTETNPRYSPPLLTPKEYKINCIIDSLVKSKKPLIVTGNGIHLSQSEEEFRNLKKLLNIPVVSTWTSKDLMCQDERLFVGNFGILGERAANFAIQNSDFLLILGSRMSLPNIGYQYQKFSPNSYKVMVDIDENEMNKPTLKIDCKIEANLKSFIPLLIESIPNTIPSWDSWIDKTQEWKKKYPVFQKEYRENGEKINSFYLMEILSEKITDNNIVVTDMGTSYTCTMQSLQMNGKNRLFTSSGCCSMGFGLPGAIGSYYGNPDKDIILIAGDGGFQMNIQELQTIVHHNIPLKMFILNNGGYLAITLMQDNLFGGNYIGSNKGSGISSPDFTKVAEAYGIKSFKFSNNSQMIGGIDEVLNYDGPVLCEIEMIENQLLIPRVQSFKNEEGKIVSGTLDNMFPFLDPEEIEKIMS